MDRLDEIRQRWGRATGGTWVAGPIVTDPDGYEVRTITCGDREAIAVVYETADHGDASFIAHAPDDVAYLLSLLGTGLSASESLAPTLSPSP